MYDEWNHVQYESKTGAVAQKNIKYLLFLAKVRLTFLLETVVKDFVGGTLSLPHVSKVEPSRPET